MSENKRYAYQLLAGCAPTDPELLRRHEKSFREETVPKLEEMQRKKDQGALKAGAYLLG